MSQWTHVCGIIRYVSLNQCCYPIPANLDRIKQDELNLVFYFWQIGVPYGSEGPLEVRAMTVRRGPAIVLSGDLRDYGEPDIPKFAEWLKKRLSQKLEGMICLKDFAVSASEEGGKTHLFTQATNDSFEITETII